MFSIGNIVFMAELLLAQIVFLYSYPKQKRFWIRAILAVGACILLAGFFPVPRSLLSNPNYALLRFSVLFGYTFAAAFVVFDCKWGALLTSCVGGYALQHISYHIYSILSWLLKPWLGDQETMWLELTVCLAVYVIAFFTIGRFVAKKHMYNYYSGKTLCVSAVTIFICVGLSRLYRLSATNTVTAVCISLYAITCCVLVLLLQYFIYSFASVKAERDTLQRISEEEKKQYEISKTNMELLNIRCHDIKQRMDGGNGKIFDEERQDVGRLMEIYDNTLRTGLEVLDIILNEKSMQGLQQGIKLTFLGDGSSLAFMSVMDIYSLFGNALTNALEAVTKIGDPAKKIINITIEKRGDFIFINIANYFQGECRTENGLPVTTKTQEAGFHGFGMKSIRNIAQKYHGNLTVVADGNVFRLNVYLLDENKTDSAKGVIL